MRGWGEQRRRYDTVGVKEKVMMVMIRQTEFQDPRTQWGGLLDRILGNK
jgi:hypothetical protein